MADRIYIAVPCRDRKRIAELCLPTLKETKKSADLLVLYNDGSKEYDANWLGQFGDMVRTFDEPIGIQAQRRLHFAHFWEQRHAYTAMYLTDMDAIHDLNWRSQALGIQRATGGALTCLYNTRAHTGMIGNVIRDDPKEDVIWQKYAPGISYLLTVAHVERIMKVVNDIQHFDWVIPSLFGNRCAISRVSHVDHIGFGGERHPPGANYNAGDRATNPTAYLVAKRAEIVEELERQDRGAKK